MRSCERRKSADLCARCAQLGYDHSTLDRPPASCDSRRSRSARISSANSTGRAATNGSVANSARGRRLSMSRASRSSRSRRYSCKDSPRAFASAESVRRVAPETPRSGEQPRKASCHARFQAGYVSSDPLVAGRATNFAEPLRCVVRNGSPVATGPLRLAIEP